MAFKMILLTAALWLAPGLVWGQVDFKVGGNEVQVHGFLTQGMMYSNQNNFLTMKTSEGSGAMTDGGLNISTRLTDKLRVGAQMYFYNLGELGNWHPQLDWAFLDYRFKNYFGIRAGKVKTVLGLNNDTQDMSSIHTWALLPQSIYPMDLRSQNIAHNGVDLYGNISLRHAGSLDYTAYAGLINPDWQGGNVHSAGASFKINAMNQRTTGADLRWNTPVNGLTAGVSLGIVKRFVDLGIVVPGGSIPLRNRMDPERTWAYYVDYTRGNWRFTGEGRNSYALTLNSSPIYRTPDEVRSDDQSYYAWYGAVSYRISKRLEVGTYHSRFKINPGKYGSARGLGEQVTSDHIYDQAVTARVDLNRFWNVKVEGHFMDGYGSPYSARGFYTADNPDGLKPKTNLFVVRTGWSF